MSEPIKLTDEIIGLIAYSLAMVEGREDSVAIESAIRALRDRARAVVFDARESHCMECGGGGDVNVREVAIDALREVLT